MENNNQVAEKPSFFNSLSKTVVGAAGLVIGAVAGVAVTMAVNSRSSKAEAAADTMAQ